MWKNYSLLKNKTLTSKKIKTMAKNLPDLQIKEVGRF